MQGLTAKIGLFLDAEPIAGGAFQFSQSMLEAVSSLPEDQFAKTVVYTHPRWKAYIGSPNYSNFYLKAGVWGKLACRRLSGMLPLPLWHKYCPLFHPPARFLLRQNCDLWIFPAQDTWTYLLPVSSLGVIFDLMHRYECRFPEVSSRGIYASRERHYNNMCRFSQGILVDSEVGKKQVAESYGVESAKIHVLPFVAPKYVRWNCSNDEPIYDLPEKFLFYPAQFWEHKNHKKLIEAIALLRHKFLDVSMVFVGSRKNGYSSARSLVEKLELSKNIHFLGYVPDSEMPKIYRCARAMIMPTFFGPTNIPPLEAHVSGCPAAVSRIYGMTEQLGNAALFFNPSSVTEIADAIERLWTDDNLCRVLARRGLERASQWQQGHFNQRLLTIIETLLQSRERHKATGSNDTMK